jgi:acetolactate synthase I/III small subunit
MEKTYTISVFTENVVGMLNRITIIFTRRHLNIESITASESEVKDVYRYTIVVKTIPDQVKKVIGQIEKLTEVLKAFYHEDSEIVHQEIALYKIKTVELSNSDAERVIRENHARILTVDKNFLIIEKTGHLTEINDLFEKLKPYGILEFACSGRVAVTKPMKELSIYLQELEEKRNNRLIAVKKKAQSTKTK